MLEQMKAEDLPINEFIFHSLLFGHTKNKDVESVNGVLEVNEAMVLFILPSQDKSKLFKLLMWHSFLSENYFR